MKKIYETPKFRAIAMDMKDIITLSIAELFNVDDDSSDNDNNIGYNENDFS